MTKGLARGLGEFNINVNAVAPGMTSTEATQTAFSPEQINDIFASQVLKRLTRPEHITGTVVFLSSADADQIIGQINMSSLDEWTPEQKNLIESIAAQAALALENARLVEESQSIAIRERLANEVTSKVWASTTIDSILQTTVRELGRALEAAEVDIEVSMDGDNE